MVKPVRQYFHPVTDGKTPGPLNYFQSILPIHTTNLLDAHQGDKQYIETVALDLILSVNLQNMQYAFAWKLSEAFPDSGFLWMTICNRQVTFPVTNFGFCPQIPKNRR